MHIWHYTYVQEGGGAAETARNLLGQSADFGLPASQIWEVGGEGTDALFSVEEEDIVHIHSCRDWLDLLGGYKRKAPLVITVHDCSLFTGGCVYPLDCIGWKKGCPDCPRGFEGAAESARKKKELLFSLRPLLAAPSGWMAAMLKEVYPFLRVRIIPNGVQWTSVEPKLGSRIPVLLFVAHSGESAVFKGGHKWRDIYLRIRKEFPDIRAYFVGGKKHEYKKGVQCLPLLPNAELRKLMQRCLLLVYPSLADNHPLVILEAMSSGLPVAATGVGGVPEQIKNKETGLLARNPRELAEVVSVCLKQRRQLRMIAHNAWREGRSKFCSERMFTDYSRVYTEALGGRAISNPEGDLTYA